MKEEILRMESIQDYTSFLGATLAHPLVNIVDLSTVGAIRHRKKYFGFYCIYLKESSCGTILYGRQQYDYQDGTMLFVAPGQVHGVNDGGETSADKVYLSPNYFGDLIKRETGKTAQEYIQDFVVRTIKERLHSRPEKNISEIAYSLGFKYPHHLSRIFKKSVGMTPAEYRLHISQH